MSVVIGLDIGSSAIKAVLFDSDAQQVLSSDRQDLNSRVLNLPPGHFEEDPNNIRKQAFAVIAALALEAKQQNRTVEAIAFTGQMHGGLIVDSKLEPLTNFITWQDKRGDEIDHEGQSFARSLREVLHRDQTGVSIHTGFLVTTLYWLHRHGMIPSNAAHVLGIYEWLTSLLVGSAVCDISSVAAWAMYDPVAHEWRNELLQAAGIPKWLLPEVTEPGAFLGTINSQLANELGLECDVRIHAPIGDTQAAYLGSGCKPNEVLLNFGTGSQSMWETSLPYATQGTDIRYLRNGRYLCCAPTLAGGEAYRIVANFFRETIREFMGVEISMEQVTEVMDRLAFKSDSMGMKIDPIFSGSKFRSVSERASMTGITRENFRPDALVRALVEGMIEEVATPYFEREGRVVHSGLIGGGGAMRRNLVLRQFAQARFGLPLTVGPFEDEAAVGAAMLCSL